MFKFLKWLFKDFHIMCAAYSNNVFPEPLSSEEEQDLIIKMNNNDIVEGRKVENSDECIISNANFISSVHPTFALAKFRYRGEDHPVELEYLDDGKIRVKYSGQAKAVTPGQACVLYLGEECIGSGIIDEVKKNNENLWYLC